MVFAGMQEIQKNKEFQNLFKFASKKDDDKDEKKDKKKGDDKKSKNPFAKKDKKENPFAKNEYGKKRKNPFAKRENPFAKKDDCKDDKKSDKAKKNAYLVRSLSKVSQVLNESGYVKSSLYAIKALETLVAKAQEEIDEEIDLDFGDHDMPRSSIEMLLDEDETSGIEDLLDSPFQKDRRNMRQFIDDNDAIDKDIDFEMEDDFEYDMGTLMDSDIDDVLHALRVSERIGGDRKEKEKIFFETLGDGMSYRDDNAAFDLEIEDDSENLNLKDLVNFDPSFDDLMSAFESVSDEGLSEDELERAFIQELNRDYDYGGETNEIGDFEETDKSIRPLLDEIEEEDDY